MNHRLSYTFDAPTKALPEYKHGISSLTPCCYWWRPSIYCDDVSKQKKAWYTDHGIPYPQANIVEIYVESIRSYYLLCAHSAMREYYGLVRILYPSPDKQKKEKSINCAVFCYAENELTMGSKIIFNVGGCVCKMPYSRMEQVLDAARVAVFPVCEENTSCFLCAAISSGCSIVSSDAGSAVEYLSKFAPPGSWHVVHNHMQAKYDHAVRHLLGMKSDINRSMYVDDLPYDT